MKRGDVAGLTSDPEALAKRVAEFFERNGIKADPEATLKKWEGKEAQLLKSMVVHENRGDDEEEKLMHDVLTTGDVLWLEAAFQNYVSKAAERSFLTKDEFKAVVAKLSDKAISELDLETAFDLADEDNSGGIDQEEFYLLYARIKKGEVEGIGMTSKIKDFFEKHNIKADLGATMAKWEGKEDALLERMEAHEAGRDTVMVHGILDVGDMLWLDAAFKGYTKLAQPPRDYLTKSEFKDVVDKLAEDVPRQEDVDAAFEQADEDNSGGIDYPEFVKLYASVKRGDVKGVGMQSKVAAFFRDNGIEADVEATLETWKVRRIPPPNTT